MTVATYATNTQAASIGTEHFLSSPNVAGKFKLILDLSNMLEGDYLEVRRYKMAVTGGTSRVIDVTIFQGAPITDGAIAESAEIWNDLTDTNACRFSIKQTLGTGRNFPWSVLSDITPAPDNTSIASILTKVTPLPSDPADASDVDGAFSTLSAKVDTVDDIVNSILLKVNPIPGDPADASDIAAAFSSLSTQIDTVDSVVDSILSAIDPALSEVKAQTDLMIFNGDNAIKANITHVIDDPVQENGADDTNWGGSTV